MGAIVSSATSELRRLLLLEEQVQASAGLKCPDSNCGDQGGYGIQVGENEYEQAQCQFCWEVLDSVFHKTRAAAASLDDLPF